MTGSVGFRVIAGTVVVVVGVVTTGSLTVGTSGWG